MIVQIRDVIARRSDLSTFLVHLTRSDAGETAKDRLISILRDGRIEARSAFGHAKKPLEKCGLDSTSQRCVCFTETPLEYIHLLLEDILDRTCRFGPYGIALPKRRGRLLGVNPVWYVDISTGGDHSWLANPLNELIDEAIDRQNFDTSAIGKLTPFIEQMGTGATYRKEFWWEREWRHSGDLTLPRRVLPLCPENDFDEFERLLADIGRPGVKCIDPMWGLERIIAHLAGFGRDDVEQM